MPTGFPFFLSDAHDEHRDMRRGWFWFVALGVLLIFVGLLALTYPVLATFTTVSVFGFMLLAGAAVEVGSSLWARRWGGFFLHLLCGVLYLFLGMVLIEHPGQGAAVYTFLLAVFFVATGLFRSVYAVAHRFSGWGWTLLSGLVTLLLGVIVWRQFPLSALWLIGTFVGIEMLFNGWSWVMLGLAVKNVPAGAEARA